MRLAGLGDVEGHAIQLVEQVVGELDVGFVDLVDKQDHPLVCEKRFSERTVLDVSPHIADVAIAEARIVQALDGVVDVVTLLSLAGRADIPAQEVHHQALGNGFCQHRLAGTGFTPDEQRLLQGYGDIHRVPQLG